MLYCGRDLPPLVELNQICQRATTRKLQNLAHLQSVESARLQTDAHLQCSVAHKVEPCLCNVTACTCQCDLAHINRQATIFQTLTRCVAALITSVEIGTDCFVGHGVMFTNDLFSKGGPARGDRTLWRSTRIGDRVSIGSNATLLPVSICSDVVIGAGARVRPGSVVTRSVPAGATAVGIPARIITAETKAEMKRVLADIQSGRFVKDFVLDNRAGQPELKASRKAAAAHPIEKVGSELRAMMPWIAKNKLVDKAKN